MGKMNRSTRMLLLRESPGENYGMENRFRDRRGREHYNNGRYAPVKNAMDYTNKPDYNHESEYGGTMREYDYRHEYSPPVWNTDGTMNRIGFEQPRNVLMLPVGNMGSKHGTMEMPNRPRSSSGFTNEMAEEWVASMQNEDGTKGPHWKMEDVNRLMKQRGIQYDPVEFWAVLNGVYSDYCAVAKKHGVNTMDFYVDFASAWINDKDAVPNKAAIYYECIAK